MFRKEDIIFIINPNSGSSKNFASKIKYLEAENITYYMSQSIEKFDSFMSENANQYKVFVLVGGDGTVNYFLQYINRYPQIVLAILPNGSGNGFAREMGFKNNIVRLVSQILNGKIQTVDLIKVNNQFSCNMIGLGIDSLVANEFSSSKERGLMTYVKLTLKTLLNYKPIEATIHINDKIIKGKYLMINIANTRQFGNNAFISPQSKYNDGLIELILLESMPFHFLFLRLIQMFTKSLKTSKYITYIETKKLKIESNAAYFHLDGEPFALQNKGLTIEVQQSFQVIKP